MLLNQGNIREVFLWLICQTGWFATMSCMWNETAQIKCSACLPSPSRLSQSVTQNIPTQLNTPQGASTALCTLQTTHHTLTLHTKRCTLHTTHYTLHHTLYTWHTAHCTLHTAHCTLHTAHCTLQTSHCTLQTALCTLLTAHCTLHTAVPGGYICSLSLLASGNLAILNYTAVGSNKPHCIW